MSTERTSKLWNRKKTLQQYLSVLDVVTKCIFLLKKSFIEWKEQSTLLNCCVSCSLDYSKNVNLNQKPSPVIQFSNSHCKKIFYFTHWKFSRPNWSWLRKFVISQIFFTFKMKNHKSFCDYIDEHWNVMVQLCLSTKDLKFGDGDESNLCRDQK